jgi:hypothetical protein
VSNRSLARWVGVAALAVSATGCIFPGAGTLLEKSYAEIRGGWGEAREIQAFPAGPILDRFRAVKVARVERSADAGPMPGALSGVVETELRSALEGANLFPGGPGPTLLIRARLTTHWPAPMLAAAPSEIAARIEFLEEGRRAPLGIYYVRGLSTALARKSDEDLGRGLASGVIEVIASRRTPPPAAGPLAVSEKP